MSAQRTMVLMTLAKSFQEDTRVQREAFALERAGYKIEVLTWDRHSTMASKTTIDGVTVRGVRIAHVGEFSKSQFAVASALFQFICFFHAVLMLRRTGRLILHAHDFNTILPGFILKLIFPKKVALIYDSHEYTPGAYAEWYGTVFGQTVAVLERVFGRTADIVITVTDPIADYLREVLGRPCLVLWNCPPARNIPAVTKMQAREQLTLPDGFLILCMGSFRKIFAYEILASERLRADGMGDVRIILVGDDLPNEFLTTIERDSRFFRVREKVHPDQALLYFRACDLSFCMYKRGPNSDAAMPIKVFESALCGTPVLVSRGTYVHEFVRKNGCGVWADPESTQEILEAVNRIRRGDGTQVAQFRAHFGDLFSWENMERRLVLAYADLFGKRERSPLPV